MPEKQFQATGVPGRPGPYLGFDRSTYPGDAVMADWWQHAPLYWTGFYLAPAPHHADTSWMTKRQTLKTQGWGFGVLYLGRQAADVNLTAAQGQADAQDAAALGTRAGFPAETRIYLDVEQGGTLSTAFVAYIKAWLTELDTNTPFAPAVYCSFSHTADQVRTAAGPLNPRFWVFRLGCPPSPGCRRPTPAPHPTLSGITYAHAWQYAQSGLPQAGCADFTSTGNCNLVNAGRGFPVDLDTAISSNPSSG